jgi:hypothetical protein
MRDTTASDLRFVILSQTDDICSMYEPRMSCTALRLRPLELTEPLAALIPALRLHRHRYRGRAGKERASGAVRRALVKPLLGGVNCAAAACASPLGFPGQPAAS